MKNLNIIFLRSLAASLLFSVSFSVLSQSEIKSINASVSGGGEVVQIDFSGDMPKETPTGFKIERPARVAFDFPGVTNATGKTSFNISRGNIKNINVVQSESRTRVVLNLHQQVGYKTEVRGDSIFIFLDPMQIDSGSLSPAQDQVFVEKTGKLGVLALKDVDFRRSADGAGKVIVTLPEANIGADISRKGNGLLVEFLHSSIPEGLRRRLDVTDFGTPVQMVSMVQAGDKVRMQIDAVGDWEHSAYQSDTQFVLEIRQKKTDQKTDFRKTPVYSGEKLTLNFQDIEVRALLQVIADFTNFNIVTSDNVQGSLTLRLKDVPWDQALQIIMDAKGLGMRKTGTVMWIAPKDEIDARIKKDLEAAIEQERLEPLVTQDFQLNYIKAVDLLKAIDGSSESSSGSWKSGGGGNSGFNNNQENTFLSPRGYALAEPRTNQLIVTDTPTKLEEIVLLIKKIDVPMRQVLIEARIVEATDIWGKNLGVRLGYADSSGGWSLGGGGSGQTGWVVGNDYGDALVSTGSNYDRDYFTGNLVNLPASADSGNPATIGLSIFNSSLTRMLTLELSALESDDTGRIISSPRVVTADQAPALIEQGTEFPYLEASSSGAASLAFRKAMLKLEVTPQITPDGNIILDLDINKDSRGESTYEGIAIDSKHVQTQVLVDNGGTVVIGGIFELTERDITSKVPFLGDLPAIGRLFRQNTKSKNKSELLIFITPRILTGVGNN